MIKNIRFSTKILIANVSLIFLGYLVWYFFCHGGLCSYEFRNAILDPILYGLVGLLASTLLLVFFDYSTVMSWLKYIVSWYIPLAVFFISKIDIHSSFILALDRTAAALWWMSGLLLITVGYVVFLRWKKNNQKV